MHRLCIRCCTQ